MDQETTTYIILVLVAVLAFLVVTAVVLFFGLRALFRSVGPDRRVLEEGTPATAKITSVEQTGVWVNENPQVLFGLEVHPPHAAPYAATAKGVVAVMSVPKYQPGAEVDVRIDPNDPSRVEIVPSA